MTDQRSRPQPGGGNAERLKLLLERVRSGDVDVETAVEDLRRLPYEDMGFARVDHHRTLRNGLPEVILAQGKQPAQVIAIARGLLERSDRLLITRVQPEMAAAVLAELPTLTYHELARVLVLDRAPVAEPKPGILIATAGTADLPVAEEAAITAELMGNAVERLYDVGVAGIHRLFDQVELLWSAKVIVAVAGMDGALPSVIGGLVSVPVIAVPTSVGYGASFGGLAALLTMLNSCATGVAVVNIDNGFGAGCIAGDINRLAV